MLLKNRQNGLIFSSYFQCWWAALDPLAGRVFETVIVVFGRGWIGLWKFDAGECNIGSACSHSPNKFSHARFVFDLHLSSKVLLCFRLGGTDSQIEFLYPVGIGRKWSRTIFGDGNFGDPCVFIFQTEFLDVWVDVDLDEVFRLDDVDTIIAVWVGWIASHQSCQVVHPTFSHQEQQ